MHRNLRAACAKPSVFYLKASKRGLNRFVKEYNHIRSPEALDMKTPSDCHDFSNRPYPERISHYNYYSSIKVMKVGQIRAIRWKSYY